MKNDFNYKWSKIFASKRFKREDGFITLAPIEQHELLKDAESLVKKLTLTDVVKQGELLTCDNCKHNCLIWDDNHPCNTCAGMDNYVAR